MTEAKASDIEIYVNHLSKVDAESWLTEALTELNPIKKKKGMPKQAFSYHGVWESSSFLVVIFENVIANYTSIWFDTTDLPWSDDAECAKAAAKSLEKAVRITAGGWRQNDDPDAWVEIQPDGSEKSLIWKT